MTAVHPSTATAVPPDWIRAVSNHPPAEQAYDVHVELDDLVTAEEVRADLAADPAHRFFESPPDITVLSDGRTRLRLTVRSGDVWTAARTAMAVLPLSGYDLHSLSVVRRDTHWPPPEGR